MAICIHHAWYIPPPIMQNSLLRKCGLLIVRLSLIPILPRGMSPTGYRRIKGCMITLYCICKTVFHKAPNVLQSCGREFQYYDTQCPTRLIGVEVLPEFDVYRRHDRNPDSTPQPEIFIPWISGGHFRFRKPHHGRNPHQPFQMVSVGLLCK
jgi:hypothetical protein